MGNYFTQPQETVYPDVLDREGIKQIIGILGDVKNPTLENNPNPISDEHFNSDCALSEHLSEISVKDPEILNTSLEFIATHIKKSLESNKVYPPSNDTMAFRCGHLKLIKPDKDGKYEEYQTKEYLNKGVGGLENIKAIYRGFSVYEFKNDILKAISRISVVPLDEVYIGVRNNEFMTFAPDVETEITNCLKITWWVYQLEDGTVLPLPGTGGGVTLNEKGTIKLMDVRGLNSLVNWANCGEQQSLIKFEEWKNRIENTGECLCLCDGDRDGDLVLLKDFIDKLNTTVEGDVGDEVVEDEGEGEVEVVEDTDEEDEEDEEDVENIVTSMEELNLE